MDQAAVGLRVKSGRAVVVLLVGSVAEPRVRDLRTVPLADPEVPESTQPYHVALDSRGGAGSKAVARLVEIAHDFARRSVAEVIERYRRDRVRLLGAGIVVGSEVDPATIKNDHIRAHAEEGRLFRVVTEEALGRCGLASSVTVEKQLLAKASKTLGRPKQRLKEDVTALGRGIGGPWRAEEKAAALAAWMLLE